MNQHMKKIVSRIFLWMALVALIFATGRVSSAQENLLKSTHADLYVGATMQLSNFFNDIKYDEIKYTIAESSINKACVTVSDKGKIKAVETGEAIVSVTYILKSDTDFAENASDNAQNQTITKTENFSVTVHEVEEVTAAYGSHVNLKAFSYLSALGATYTFSNDAAVLNSAYDIVVQGLTTIEVYAKQDAEKFTVAKITVTAPTLTKSVVARAVGTTGYKAEITGYTAVGGEKITYTSKETGILATAEGINAVAVGSYKADVNFMASNGDVVALPLSVTVTNPVFNITQLVVAKGTKTTVQLSGTCAYSVIENNAEKSGAAYFENENTIYANATGSKNVTLTVDGKDITIAVIVTNPRFSQNAVAMYKGVKKNLGISGLNKTYSKITYASANKKIVTIDKNGKMKAKRVGVAYIIVRADGKIFKVLVQISTKRAYQASRKEIAISKRKTTYSQYRRMQKKYYDCSSLVSRVYRKYGVYFGSKRGWSPVAAGIGSWCSSHKKVLYRKGVSYKKLIPGDLIFYSYQKNGRYRNISHIEMYVGNGMSVSASSSRGRVVHYGYGSSCVVLIARPTK